MNCWPPFLVEFQVDTAEVYHYSDLASSSNKLTNLAEFSGGLVQRIDDSNYNISGFVSKLSYGGTQCKNTYRPVTARSN